MIVAIPPPHGAQASIVSSVLELPTQRWSALAEHWQEDEECIMCMEPYADTDEVRVLKCRHYFHTACIDKWLVIEQQKKSRSCPLCLKAPV